MGLEFGEKVPKKKAKSPYVAVFSVDERVKWNNKIEEIRGAYLFGSVIEYTFKDRDGFIKQAELLKQNLWAESRLLK